MSPREWLNLQEALLYVFGHLISWWLVFYLAGGIFLSLLIMWLSFLKILKARWF